MKYNPKKMSRNIYLLEMALGYAKAAHLFNETGSENSATKFQNKANDYITDIIMENTKPEVHKAIMVAGESEYKPMETIMSEWEAKAQKLKNLRLRPVHFTNGFRIAPECIFQDVTVDDQPVILVNSVELATHV